MTTARRRVSGFLRSVAEEIYEAVVRRTLWAIERFA